MNWFGQSRRDLLKLIGGAAATNAFGIGPWTDIYSSPAERPNAEQPIIDTHIHVANVGIPGVPHIPSTPDKKAPLPPFGEGKQSEGITQLAKSIEDEMKMVNVEQALCMPRAEVSDKDPLGIKEAEAVAALVRGPRLRPVGLAHPERFDRDHLAHVEEVLKQGRVKAFKAYLGYFHYGPTSRGYHPYYKLAADYDIPVIFHTGDTYSDKAKLKYAHPLHIDEVAVDFPKNKIRHRTLRQSLDNGHGGVGIQE